MGPRATGTVTVPLRAARLIRRLGETGLRMVRFRASEDWPDATFPFQAPRTSMNGSLSPRRGFAFCSIPMDDALRVKQAAGVTLNDVVLGTCAGALTRYLAERGEVADRPLIAQVPLALDHDDGAHRLQGNALSVMGASLATDIADPANGCSPSTGRPGARRQCTMHWERTSSRTSPTRFPPSSWVRPCARMRPCVWCGSIPRSSA